MGPLILDHEGRREEVPNDPVGRVREVQKVESSEKSVYIVTSWLTRSLSESARSLRGLRGLLTLRIHPLCSLSIFLLGQITYCKRDSILYPRPNWTFRAPRIVKQGRTESISQLSTTRRPLVSLAQT